ncbi:Peroxidase 60 [Zea mays]|uniref:Peroxidase 60 n=1 Tax=Zea mays TaxID=4577 RepID=A0A1D6JNY3_MAIZE|nr:Peroxidase 60 [Zea mays]
MDRSRCLGPVCQAALRSRHHLFISSPRFCFPRSLSHSFVQLITLGLFTQLSCVEF